MNSDSNFTLKPDTTLLHYHFYVKEGVPGTPQPYSVRTDNVLTMALLLCFVLFVLAAAKSGRVFVRQAKDLFYPSHENDTEEGPATRLFMTFMAAVDSLLLAVGAFMYATDGDAPQFTISNPSLVVLFYFALFLAYFLVKWLAYNLVNSTFFGSKKTQQWTRAFFTITALEAIMLFPLIMLLVYFDLSVKNSLFYFGFVLFLNKILLFYKCWKIFFRQNGFSLQIFLYFCALEITPLLVFGGSWLWLTDSLKVNF